MDARAVTEALGGRWHGSYGMAPCPAHEDRSPSLSLTDGAGGRLLAYCHAGCEWRDVAAALRAHGLLGDAKPSAPPPARDDQSARAGDRAGARRARQAEACWAETLPIHGTPAERYLRDRAIDVPLPPVLRFHPACWHAPTATRRPALVARVDGGEGFAVQRIYLDPDGGRLADGGKMMLGRVRGGGVRLARGAEARMPLIIAEGIETTLSLACGVLPGHPRPERLVAALSAAGLAGLALPRRSGRLVIAPDADDGGTGLAAARKLRDRARTEGWEVEMRPAPDGMDWNDVLVERAGMAAEH